MSKTKVFSTQANLRHYVYAVRVDALTGAVIEITAGCRIWKSFVQAHKHYSGKRVDIASRWRDDARAHLNGHAGDQSTENFYRRQEARTILDRLAEKVRDYQASLKRKAKLAEQAKVPVKKVAKKKTK